jgi:GDP-D-mannose dehydratase
MQFYIEKALRLDAKNWQALWYQVKLSEMFGDSQKEKATLAEIVKFYPWSQVAQSKLKALIDTKGGKSVPSAVKTFN